MTWQDLVGRESLGSWASSAVLIAALLFARGSVVNLLKRRTDYPPEMLRRWIINTRNIAVAVGLFGLVLIWGTELRAFALSIAAFAMAVVIATKELIVNVSGGVYRAGLRSFNIGERIEVAGTRGDVIDKNMMSTTVLEIGPGHEGHHYTGRAVVVPNVLLLTTPVYSESFIERFGFHIFNIPLPRAEDWKRAEQALLEAAAVECGPFLPAAREHFEALRRAHGLPAISVEPEVTVKVKDGGEIELQVRVPIPQGRTGETEQAITRAYLSRLYPETLADTAGTRSA